MVQKGGVLFFLFFFLFAIKHSVAVILRDRTEM